MNRLLFLTLSAALSAFQITGARPEASAGVFSAEESKLCAELTLSSRPWATARWEVSLTDARQRADREGKPVFLVVNTGNVLGFV
jgi:hypothetical protein